MAPGSRPCAIWPWADFLSNSAWVHFWYRLAVAPSRGWARELRRTPARVDSSRGCLGERRMDGGRPGNGRRASRRWPLTDWRAEGRPTGSPISTLLIPPYWVCIAVMLTLTKNHQLADRGESAELEHTIALSIDSSRIQQSLPTRGVLHGARTRPSTTRSGPAPLACDGLHVAPAFACPCIAVEHRLELANCAHELRPTLLMANARSLFAQ